MMLLEEVRLLDKIKQLFQVFTNKQLFIEWLLAVNIFIGKKLVRKIAELESNEYAVTHKEIDMRTAPKSVMSNIIYDEKVLEKRWSLCSSCEFLNDDNRCEKCGCFMKVKHKLSQASCPVGKWGKYIKGDINGIKSI